MSFGGGSNPPWQRNSLGNAGQPALQSQMINPNLVGFQNFNQNLAMAQHQNAATAAAVAAAAAQNNLAILGGNAMNTNQAMFNQTVQYPSTRSTMNQNAFGAGNNQQTAPFQQQMHHHQTQPQPLQQQQQQQQQAGSQMCNRMGTVTKINNQCGFIDDEVVFYKNSYSGQSPKVGDRVLFEAAYRQSAAHKWSATQVQIVPSANASNTRNSNSLPQQHLQSQQSSHSRESSGYNAVPPPNAYAGGLNRSGAAASNVSSSASSHSRAISPQSRRSVDRSSRTRNSSLRVSRSRDDDIEERRRRREKDREREKERKEKRDRSIDRRVTSPKRLTRPIPRYTVRMPKFSCHIGQADVLELRQRYNNLYVPSDFFHSNIRWCESFPPHAPFSLQKPCAFHIFNKSVAPLEPNDAEYEPADADNSFSAKVMLMGVPPMADFHRKCFATAEEKNRTEFVHPTRVINFLVGVLGKNETMAIGGAWSPSLDGPNPAGDPSVLIRTAIRTCKALTGIDLSSCTQWYRFVELYYRRKSRNDAVKTQTVVIFLPDVRSCVPTRTEWDELDARYKAHFEMCVKKCGDDSDHKHGNVDVAEAGSADTIDDSSLNEDIGSDQPKPMNNEAKMKPADDEKTTTENEKGAVGDDHKRDSTQCTDLDVKTMKIDSLRHELEVRKLSSKGLRAQLVARLTKALKTEENKPNEGETIGSDEHADQSMAGESVAIDALDESIHSNDGMDIDMADIVVIDEYDSTKVDSKSDETKLDQRELRLMERRYRLPDKPHILVHPNKVRSFDKFTCEVMSLSILLDYRPEDTKKHSFEVALFAELFNDMLMRDFGFNIYRALHSLPSQEPEKESKTKDGKRELNVTADEDEPREKRKRTDDESNGLKNVDVVSPKKDGAESSTTEAEKKRDKERRERRTSRRDDCSGAEDGSDTKKLVTVDPDLLLSFVYFDTSHCGYIFSNHVEELFHAIGLRLSRADTKKIVGKIAKNSLFYRKLTDKPKDEVTLDAKGDENKMDESNLEDMGRGNNKYLPVFHDGIVVQSNDDIVPVVTSPPVEKVEEASVISNGVDYEREKMGESTLVMHKRAMIDIEKLLHQMHRSEKAREEMESRLIEMKKVNQEIETKSAKAKDKVKELQSELKSCNRKLNDAETNLSSTNKKCSEYHSVLVSIHDKVAPIFVKEKAERNSSSCRDREKREHRDREERERGDSVKASKEKDVTKADVKSEETQ